MKVLPFKKPEVKKESYYDTYMRELNEKIARAMYEARKDKLKLVKK